MIRWLGWSSPSNFEISVSSHICSWWSRLYSSCQPSANLISKVHQNGLSTVFAFGWVQELKYFCTVAKVDVAQNCNFHMQKKKKHRRQWKFELPLEMFKVYLLSKLRDKYCWAVPNWQILPCSQWQRFLFQLKITTFAPSTYTRVEKYHSVS